jgi:hypothetical protein
MWQAWHWARWFATICHLTLVSTGRGSSNEEARIVACFGHIDRRAQIKRSTLRFCGRIWCISAEKLGEIDRYAINRPVR